ncbi:hypothetical protein [Lentzea aerocolonigenes]|uniref:hypothetical protein n=1 Tax=Lentzea aerocolonigenes TaxID=68170 RepID=UPI000A690473|nr:hypothetical protein [Lentzea aerocolonigenes]MCP2243519.1 hypothetical protein [Lentzea aerocolonigenes]
MRELLYIPDVNPPEQVLNHAILYRDSISTFVPDDTGAYLADRTKYAFDAGIFQPRLIASALSDESVKAEALTLMRRCVMECNEAGNFMRVLSTAPPDKLRESAAQFGGMLRYSFEFNGADVKWGDILAEIIGDEEWRRPVASLEDQGLPLVLLGSESSTMLLGVAFAVAEKARKDCASPLVLPVYPEGVSDCLPDDFSGEARKHLFARVDVGQFLPQPPLGAETASVIAFRQRYEDERRRLVLAVERLVKEAARAHGSDESADIARDVREELSAALADVERAGRRRFGGWLRRAAWFTVASGLGSVVAGPAGAAGGSLAVNWASNRLPDGSRESDYRYLYRVQGALDEFIRS